MQNRRNQFTFYASYYDAIQHLKKQDQLAVIMAICAYALDGEEPDWDKLPDAVAVVFEICRPLLDLDIRQSAEGRRSIEYKEWRKSVYERDSYRCQACGARGVRLNAHHRKQYAFFPELRYDLDNGVTLCVACHKAEHRRMRHGD